MTIDKPVVKTNNSFPANSKTSKANEREKVNKVIVGSAVKKKKTFHKKFVESFFGEGVEDVGSHVLFEILIPAAQETISNMVTGAVDMALYGERRSSNNKGRNSNGYFNYAKGNKSTKNTNNKKTRIGHDLDDIVLDNRGDAEQVLEVLIDYIDEYGKATVADLYDMIGASSEYTDSQYGWTNMDEGRSSRVKGGYALVLPQPKQL